MTNLLPTEEQIEAALRLARGEWQRAIIKTGYSALVRSATRWLEEYEKSLFRLCERLRKAGIEARAFVNTGTLVFYLVIGTDWTTLVDRVDSVMSPASLVYARLREGEFSAEMEKVLRQLQLRNKLRFLIAECKDTLSTIGNCYSNSLCHHYDPQKAYSEAMQLVEKVEKKWNEIKDWVGIFLL
jgi:hypothetical protein